MDIKQLEYVIVVAETKSMHLAAERLHVSQQNISRVLKQLEDELNVQIFSRSAFGTYLTEDGQDIYLRALTIVKEVSLLKQKYADSTHQALKGQLQIYFSNTLSEVVSPYLRCFQQEYPEVIIVSTEAATEKIFSLMNQIQISLAFMQVSEERLMQEKDSLSQKYDCYLLSKEPLKVAMHKDNPYADRTSISLKKLQELPLIVNSPSLDSLPCHIQTLLDKGIALNLKYCSNSEQMLKKYITQNQAFALTTKTNIIEGYVPFVYVPIKERIYIAICFLVEKGKASACTEMFKTIFFQRAPSNCKKIF